MQRVPKLNQENALALTFALLTAGYAGFADAIACLFMIKPIPSEYDFADRVTPDQWLAVTLFITCTYGVYTFSAEGKSSYDTAKQFFINRRRGISPLPLDPPAQTPLMRSPRGKWAVFSVGLAARLICLIGSAADSAETTMGLVEEEADMPKLIAISTLSFIGSFAFYSPFTIEAFEALFLGKAIPPETAYSTYKIALVLGYFVAVCSSLYDTLECSASLYDNFEVRDSASRWCIVGFSLLAGISNFCLDGRSGVKILNHFFAHLENAYAWALNSASHCSPPSRDQCIQLSSEAARFSLAAYAASYIAFADKELTLTLSQNILIQLGLEVPVLPELLGWCVVLMDFVIKTNIFYQLERLLISLANQCLERFQRGQTPVQAALEAVELKAIAEMDQETEDEITEETTLLTKNTASPSAQRENSAYWARLFNHQPQPRRQNSSEPRRVQTSCAMM